MDTFISTFGTLLVKTGFPEKVLNYQKVSKRRSIKVKMYPVDTFISTLGTLIVKTGFPVKVFKTIKKKIRVENYMLHSWIWKRLMIE